MTIDKRHVEWLDRRNIDVTIAEKFGVTTTRDASGFWLTVPFTEAGKPVNHKYRMTSEKRHRMDKDAPLLLWNADALSHPEVLAGTPLVITEGEWDALAAMSAGLRHVVSVPNGAPQQATDAPIEAKRYQFVHRHLDALDKVKTFVLATDGDDAGRILAADLVSLLGPERCRFVTYPDQCKDLNDVLMLYGHSAVVEVINGAKPYPIKGVYGIDDFPEKSAVVAWPTGIAPLAEMLMIVPGTLTVFTGYANMGKSTVVNSLLAHLIQHNIPVCIASFETEVKPILRDNLRASIARCSLHDARSRDMTAVDALIRENVSIISQLVEEDDEMDLDYFLDLCRTVVIRNGVKVIVLDPWNELEHKRRRDETETDYISRALRAIKRFAKQFDVAFWIVAHPTKPQEGKARVPGLYDISGSANWANKADYGLTYHRAQPDQNRAELRVTKVRMGLPGQKGSVFVSFDFRSSEFVLADAA
jgi:twinkle protein